MKLHITIAIVLASIVATASLVAQANKPNTVPTAAPLQYLGKTFEECEKLLGKPTRQETVQTPVLSFFRYYASPIPQAATIRLVHSPKTPVPRQFTEGVTQIVYYFPKGRLKGWEDAFPLFGLSTEGAKAAVSSEFTTITGIPGGFLAQWTPARTKTKYQGVTPNPNEDMLLFMPDPNFGFKPNQSPAPVIPK